MQQNSILLSVDERRTAIEAGVKKLAASVKGEAILTPELLAEVADLVEHPLPLLGSFEAEYLALPEDVLISVMKKHQRYFPIRQAGGGALLPYFVIVRNGDEEHLDLVRQGNEHVLRARFADANFFVREDLKHKLEDFRPQLSKLIFQKKLGNMLDKAGRIEALTPALASMLKLDAGETLSASRAAHLLKADLATRMVVEMTSLQGIMGREYALRSGEAPAVADAIGEQYKAVPGSKPGLAAALADRLDSLMGHFAANLAPTGAKDPFGLRRAAIGVVQPLIEHGLDFDLRSALSAAAGLQPIPVSPEALEQVQDFLSGRLRVVLMDSGFRYDVVEAVLAAQSNNPARAAESVRQLTAWVGRKDWDKLLPAYARCARILRSQPAGSAAAEVDPGLFQDPAEKDLYEAVQVNAAHPPQSVDEFLTSVTRLMEPINLFFEKVLVMAEEPRVRGNRLALLQRIAGLADGLADLSKLEGF